MNLHKYIPPISIFCRIIRKNRRILSLFNIFALFNILALFNVQPFHATHFPCLFFSSLLDTEIKTSALLIRATFCLGHLGSVEFPIFYLYLHLKEVKTAFPLC